MPEIIKLESIDPIPNLPEGWSIKTDSKSVIGKKIHKSESNGREYVYEAKYVEKYGFWARFGRGLLGVLCTIGSGGIAWCCDTKYMKQLFTKDHKASKVFARAVPTPTKPPVVPNSTPSAKQPTPPPVRKLTPPATAPTVPSVPAITPGGPTISLDDDSSTVNSSNSTASSAISKADEERVQKFNDLSLRWGCNASLLEQYRSDINTMMGDSHKWDVKWAEHILRELLSLQDTSLVTRAEELVMITGKSETEMQQVLKLPSSFHNIHEESQKLIEFLMANWREEKKPEINTVGFSNVGNSCYINSALQPLLAHPDFINLVPKSITKYSNETDKHFDARKRILASLNEFLDEWKKPVRSPYTLGGKIGQLRHVIYEEKVKNKAIDEFTFDQGETGIYDAGDFYELILNVIGQTYKRKKEIKGFLADGTEAITQRAYDGEPFQIIPENVSILCGAGSIQNRIDATGAVVKEAADPRTPWMVKNPKTPEWVQATFRSESFKIVGNPPPIMIVKINSIVNADIYHTMSNRYVIDPKADMRVNFAPLVENPTDEGAIYELVGFSQNHGRYHWTSVVREGDHWNSCNDSSVNVVSTNSSTFSTPASFLVYRKVN